MGTDVPQTAIIAVHPSKGVSVCCLCVGRMGFFMAERKSYSHFNVCFNWVFQAVGSYVSKQVLGTFVLFLSKYNVKNEVVYCVQRAYWKEDNKSSRA